MIDFTVSCVNLRGFDRCLTEVTSLQAFCETLEESNYRLQKELQEKQKEIASLKKQLEEKEEAVLLLEKHIR